MDCTRGEHELVEGCEGTNAKNTEIQVVRVPCLPFLCLGYSNIAPFMTYQKRVRCMASVACSVKQVDK
jgi:hypothetical protein